jgi:hypothetical protein
MPDVCWSFAGVRFDERLQFETELRQYQEDIRGIKEWDPRGQGFQAKNSSPAYLGNILKDLFRAKPGHRRQIAASKAFPIPMRKVLFILVKNTFVNQVVLQH